MQHLSILQNLSIRTHIRSRLQGHLTLCKWLLLGLLSLAVLAAAQRPARAQTNPPVSVYVSYAENERLPIYFPNPWQGSSNTIFLGSAGGNIGVPNNAPFWDCGAFLLLNTGTSNVVLAPGVYVDNFPYGERYQIWDTLIGSSVTIRPGQGLILAQTSFQKPNITNFDTSDVDLGKSAPNTVFPVLHVTLNGTKYTFTDTAQVITTGQHDLGTSKKINESIQWRPIGTTGVDRGNGFTDDWLGTGVPNLTTPVSVSGVSINPSSVAGGTSTQGTVTLNGPTPDGWIVVGLSSNKSSVRVPVGILVSAGASSFNFPIMTTSVSSTTTATITASYYGMSSQANLTVTPAATSGSFVLGVAVGGPAVTIDGNQWTAYSQALANGLSMTGGTIATTRTVTWTPTPDAGTATMLGHKLYHTTSVTGVGFTLKQRLPNGKYVVYVWMGEDKASNSHEMNVLLNGTTVATGIGLQTLGTWQKFGPYSVSVSNGVLQMDVQSYGGLSPRINGFAIFNQ
jgi:hypothetical protein